ncbi:beta-amyrin 6-beta-monooxygenase-like [Silene latifolia]|uniref:beta-amyrin 6-beta-monooxygenase-like n=1 Tax=Silene latifolia TaxID=37657 RepID=UPI003D77E780
MAPNFFYFSLGITSIITLLVISLIILNERSKTRKPSKIPKLPPGKIGWPIFGETLAYVSCPAKFIHDRMTMYSPEVFKTSLAGEKTVVFCGPKANKFLFSNEGKLVNYWLPSSVAGALSYPKTNNKDSASGKPADNLAYKFLRGDTIQQYVPLVHSMVQQHVRENWLPNNEVKVYTLAKEFIFALSCRVLVNPSLEQLSDIAKPFFRLLDGIFSVPINLPGMPYYKAIKGGKLVREKLVEIIKQRRQEMSHIIMRNNNNNNNNNNNYQLDLLSRLIIDCDKNNKGLSEEEIASKVIGLMFAGFYPTSTTIAFLISHLADHPHVYEKVLQEQLKISESKEAGEQLTWIDVQKMKYSWNVICETMRVSSPVPGNFREAKSDFTYAGFHIPKGWKVHWTLHSTHKNPDYFPDPEKFDPERFANNEPAPYTFVPFGGGPRMCAGKEFARIEMLVFLHNVVTKFRFKKINPDQEKIIYNPDPIPTKGLRIFLQPH